MTATGIWPEDVALVESMARANIYFYDGPGVILPSGVRKSGEEMRDLLAGVRERLGLAAVYEPRHGENSRDGLRGPSAAGEIIPPPVTSGACT